MKLTSLIILFLLSLSPLANDEEKMRWREDRKLTWSDFKGSPEPGGAYVASTNSGITFSFSYSIRAGEMELDYSIVSYFYPNLSWYKQDRVTPYILKHEQTHFDISELHARKLRKLMAETAFAENPSEQANALYEQIEKQRRAMQRRYDAESDHSKIAEEELKWRAFVASELRTYEVWK